MNTMTTQNLIKHLNEVTIVGNVAAAPDFKYTSAGRAVCSVVLYNTNQWLDKDGVKKEKVQKFKVTGWGEKAEAMNANMGKGDLVKIYGSASIPETWVNKNGEQQTQATVDFIEGEVLFTKREAAPAPADVDFDAPTPAGDDDMGDIPF